MCAASAGVLSPRPEMRHVNGEGDSLFVFIIFNSLQRILVAAWDHEPVVIFGADAAFKASSSRSTFCHSLGFFLVAYGFPRSA